VAGLLKRRDELLAGGEWHELIRQIRARTPARVLAGRAGAGYRTDTQLDLREAHAAARDAVRDELDLSAALGLDFVGRWELREFRTRARNKDEYLLRHDLGRKFDDESSERLSKSKASNCDIQLAIGDGLSVAAVAEQVPHLLPLLFAGVKARGWTAGRAFVIRHCRVGILNEIGELLKPQVALLLIGERPGLATATSLSAYMAFRPTKAHTDADRNLISNIHARGVGTEEAAERILELAAQMMHAKASGCRLREETRGLE